MKRRDEFGGLAGLVVGAGVGGIAALIAGDGALVLLTLGLVLGVFTGGWYGSASREEDARLFLVVAVQTEIVAVLARSISRATKDAWWQSILIGVAAAALGVLVTVFYIDRINRERDRLWRRPKRDPGVFRIKMVAWATVNHIAQVVGRESDVQTMTDTRHLGWFRLTPLGHDFVANLEAMVKDDLRKIDPQWWPALGRSFGERAREFYDAALLYDDVIEPDEARILLLAQQYTQSVSGYIATDIKPIKQNEPLPVDSLILNDEHIQCIVNLCHRLLRIDNPCRAP